MPPTDGSSIRGRSTSVREWVCSLHMAKLQAASMLIAYSSCMPRAGADRDRSRYRLMPPPMAGGIIIRGEEK